MFQKEVWHVKICDNIFALVSQTAAGTRAAAEFRVVSTEGVCLESIQSEVVR
jgi:hypothetical protein